jgi:hypothetical protein
MRRRGGQGRPPTGRTAIIRPVNGCAENEISLTKNKKHGRADDGLFPETLFIEAILGGL